MIGLWWLGCTPGPEVAPDTTPPAESAPPPESTPPEPECPPLEWVVLYGTSFNRHQLSRVAVLPGGDLLVAGMGGTGALGTGPRGFVSHDSQGSAVARLSPSGEARWAHSVGAGTSRPAFSWTDRSVWVVGDQTYGPLRLDNVLVADAPAQPTGFSDAFAARFDLATGSMDRWLYVGGDERQQANAVAEDDLGNVYVTGTYTSPTLDLGDGVGLAAGPPYEDRSDWAWLGSWDAQGRARWVVGAPWASGEGVAVKGRTLVWNVLGGDHGWMRSDGTTTPFERLEDQVAQVIYPVDPDTGTVLPTRAAIYGDNTSWEELGVDRAGDLTAAGRVVWIETPTSWTDLDGQSHPLGTERSTQGVGLTLHETGRIRALDVSPVYSTWGGDVGQRVFTGQLPGAGVVFNPGTRAEFHLEGDGSISGMNGLAGWVDDDGLVRCAWSFQSRGADFVPDAVLDDGGGFVVVGAFETTMELRDRTNTVIHTFEKDVQDASADGFVMRFAWPDPE